MAKLVQYGDLVDLCFSQCNCHCRSIHYCLLFVRSRACELSFHINRYFYIKLIQESVGIFIIKFLWVKFQVDFPRLRHLPFPLRMVKNLTLSLTFVKIWVLQFT